MKCESGVKPILGVVNNHNANIKNNRLNPIWIFGNFDQGKCAMKIGEVVIQTPLGLTVITGNEAGLTSLSVIDADMVTPSSAIPDGLKPAVEQLHEYFSGTRKVFQLKLNHQGTDFQKSVWQELLSIPYGKTISYLELSRRLGDVKAIRAVAAANGQNPFWIVVPCHRVIGSDGSLTGYAGGLWRKKWLLEHESPYRQQALF